MKYLTILSMSFLSILFGCNNKKTPAPQPAESPRFPESDNPLVKIQPIVLDSGYGVHTFFIPADKQTVIVLASREIPTDPDRPGYAYENLRYRLYGLTPDGQIKHRLDIKPTLTNWGGSMGLMDNQLYMLLGDHFWEIDTHTFAIREKIPVYDSQNFPSKTKVELMTFDEQRDNYELVFNAMLKKYPDCKWLDWTPGGKYFLVARDQSGKQTVWDPLTYEDAYVADLKSKYEPIPVPLNQGYHDGVKEGSMEITDGPVHIWEAAYISAGTELDYPNYKNRKVLNYELTLGQKKARFSTTDKKRHNLHLGFSDNWMLATQDGAGWVKYEGVLYRVE